MGPDEVAPSLDDAAGGASLELTEFRCGGNAPDAAMPEDDEVTPRCILRTRGTADAVPPMVELTANLSHRHCGRQKSIPCDFTLRRGRKSWSVWWFINDERVKFLAEVTGDERISWQFVSRLEPWQP
jgi:hypothetical protein